MTLCLRNYLISTYYGCLNAMIENKDKKDKPYLFSAQISFTKSSKCSTNTFNEKEILSYFCLLLHVVFMTGIDPGVSIDVALNK